VARRSRAQNLHNAPETRLSALLGAIGLLCHHRGGAAARRALGRAAPGAESGRSSPTRRPARLRTACGGAGGPAARRAAPGRAGPRVRRGGAASAGPGRAGRSIRAQQPGPPAGLPPDGVWRRLRACSAPGCAAPRRAAAAARRRGGAARAGPDRAGRSIRAQHPDPLAGPLLDGVRRRWGAGSAPGRTGQRRAAALPHVAPPPRRCQGGHSCWFLGHFGDYGRVMAVPRRSRGTLSALLIISAKRAHLRFAVPGTSWR
jgi:hypothetical protein